MPRVDHEYLESRRRQIMDAAVACFAREGFHRTTMQDIVRETSLSAGAIYRYFPAKEDIVAAIAEDHMVPEAAILAGAEVAGDVVATLRQLIDASLGRLADQDEQRWRRVTVQLWAEALRNERVMQVVRSGLDDPVRVLAELIARAQQDGTLPADFDADAGARVFAAIFQGLVLQQAWDPTLDMEAYVQAVLVLFDTLTARARRST